MVNIPKIKRKLASFLSCEEGKISKEKLLKAGLVLGIVAAAQLKEAKAGHSHEVNKYPCPIVAGEAPRFYQHHHTLTLSYGVKDTDVTVDGAPSIPSVIGKHNHCVGSHASHLSN